MTLAHVSTIALFGTAALYGALGIGFSKRNQWRSATALYGLAILALIGALL